MIEFLITDQNFDQIESRQETTPVGITTKLVKSKNVIKITVNTMAPFAVFKWEQDGHFAISNRLDDIANYIESMNYELTYEAVESKYIHYTHAYVNKSRDCSNVQKITRWSKVMVVRSGDLQIIPPKKQPFSVNLTSKRGVKLLLAWLKKYLILAKQEIRKKNFIPCLTGGLDTRALTWFWRDLYDGPNYFLKAIKPDGRNDFERGQIEINIVTQVLNRLGKSFNRKETHKEATFWGSYTDHGQKEKCVNDPDFIYDYLTYVFTNPKMYSSSFRICPFIDNLFLQLRHPKHDYMRTFLVILLCPDLLDIECLSLPNKPTYILNEKFPSLVSQVEKFIQQYDLRNRIAKLKARVLSRR